ncbi:hypothetical protein LJC42_04790 [Eubacteriales bacterium OttesenSCG-928-K08]|nr:hypothetical protein [Eubacteriales bacterium OttesenSCG-928-K08]
MAYRLTGVQAMFPVLLSRHPQNGLAADDYDTSAAQNENNMNQNFSILYQKLVEMEEQLAQL